MVPEYKTIAAATPTLGIASAREHDPCRTKPTERAKYDESEHVFFFFFL